MRAVRNDKRQPLRRCIARRALIVGACNRARALNIATAADAMAHRTSGHAHDMSYREMADVMQMDDTTRFGKVHARPARSGAPAARARRGALGTPRGYYGGDYNKLWVKTEGKYVSQWP